jgi:hypothetical protein
MNEIDGEAVPVSEAHITGEVRVRLRRVGNAGALRTREPLEGSDRRGDLAILSEFNVTAGIANDLITWPVGRRLRSRTLANERPTENEQGYVSEEPGVFEDPALSVAPGGRFLAAWRVYSPTGDTLRSAVGHLPSPRLGPVVTQTLGAAARSLQAAVDSSGQAVITWIGEALTTGNPLPEATVIGMFRTSTGEYTAPTVLDEVPPGNDIGDAAVTIDEHGQGTAVWRADPNYIPTLMARRFRIGR